MPEHHLNSSWWPSHPTLPSHSGSVLWIHPIMLYCSPKLDQNRAPVSILTFPPDIISTLTKLNRHHNPYSPLLPSSPHQGPLIHSATPYLDSQLNIVAITDASTYRSSVLSLSLPSPPILIFNLAGFQCPHSHPQHSAYTNAAIVLEPQFPWPHSSCARTVVNPASCPICLCWTHSKMASFSVPSARLVGTLTNPRFVIDYVLFCVGVGAVAVGTHEERTKKKTFYK